MLRSKVPTTPKLTEAQGRKGLHHSCLSAGRLASTLVCVDDEHDRRTGALTELSDADRAYRAAFRHLTSRGALEGSSFEELLASIDRLRQAVIRLADS